MEFPNQTRQPSGQNARTVITHFVDKSPVNCRINHMFTMFVFVPAEQEADFSLHLCAVENMIMYIFATGHFAKVSCVAYRPPKQGFSNIKKHITKLQLMVLTH